LCYAAPLLFVSWFAKELHTRAAERRGGTRGTWQKLRLLRKTRQQRELYFLELRPRTARKPIFKGLNKKPPVRRIAQCVYISMATPWPPEVVWSAKLREHAMSVSKYLRDTLLCVDRTKGQPVPASSSRRSYLACYLLS